MGNYGGGGGGGGGGSGCWATLMTSQECRAPVELGSRFLVVTVSEILVRYESERYEVRYEI